MTAEQRGEFIAKELWDGPESSTTYQWLVKAVAEAIRDGVAEERAAIRAIVAAEGTEPHDDAPGTIRHLLEQIDARSEMPA